LYDVMITVNKNVIDIRKICQTRFSARNASW
jgi:hypothetical protein